MKVSLYTTLGGLRGTTVRITHSPFTIGRTPACDLCVKSSFASRRHCELAIEDEAVWIRDCGSRNGTLVNGDIVLDSRELQHGDLLTFGELQYEVLIEATKVKRRMGLFGSRFVRCNTGP